MMLGAADVSRETVARIGLAKRLILEEADRQNLIAASTIADFDSRHLADSLQLVPYLRNGGDIVDIGSGAGIPGLFIACVVPAPVHLVEPRAKRSRFLEYAIDRLDLSARVRVHAMAVERIELVDVGTILARAVAPLDRLFGMAEHLAAPDTRWVLPKGRNADAEVAQAARTWQGDFRIVASRTAGDSAIVVAEHVRRRQRA